MRRGRPSTREEEVRGSDALEGRAEPPAAAPRSRKARFLPEPLFHGKSPTKPKVQCSSPSIVFSSQPSQVLWDAPPQRGCRSLPELGLGCQVISSRILPDLLEYPGH
jgi:hypothetical protein